jgi:hypothetical protein
MKIDVILKIVAAILKMAERIVGKIFHLVRKAPNLA